ncbi:MAG: Ig-like domain-containing protein [Candidatus Gracilibacteria bacterium]|nr:Ig-like domain-containing protein [Candidatus Gracilibacteria bacterium]
MVQFQKETMKKLFLGAIIFFLGLGVTQAQAAWLSVSNTTAGKVSDVQMSELQAHETVSFLLTRPDQSKLSFSAAADEWGRLQTEIFGLHLEQAGVYDLTAARANFPATTETFSVLPGPVSRYRSSVDASLSSVAADGEAEARVQISLRDTYGNPLPGQSVKVFSSRNEDRIVASPVSDFDGTLTAKVSSAEPGVSILSVLAEETLLFDKVELVFFLADKSLPQNVGSWGKALQAQLFEDPEEGSTAAYLTLEELPSEIQAEQDLTVRVVAKDEDGNPVPNYLGTVRFSSSDDEAQLPNDYTFAPSDQGAHTFFLAVRFGTPGQQILAVHDLADFRISGEMETNVILSGDPVPVDLDEPGVTITMPPEGSTFNTARITLSGKVVGCEAVQITDGTYELVNDLEIDTTGKFVYQTPRLADGMHQFQATCTADPSLQSRKVTVTIDRTPPQVMGVEQIPSGPIEPGQNFQIKVSSSDELSQVRGVFNEFLTEFSPDTSGGAGSGAGSGSGTGDAGSPKVFSATFTAPAEPGEYPLSVTLVDLLGNPMEEPNAAVISVGVPEPEPEPEPDPDEFIAPTAVSSLTATSGEEEKVTLFWSPAEDDTGISHYRVDFSTCEANDFSQTNETPDDRTQWYVAPLEACVKYCFRVTAIDTDGNEGVASNVAEGTPLCPDPVHEAPPKTGANTPWWAIIVAGLIGVSAVFVIRQRS